MKIKSSDLRIILTDDYMYGRSLIGKMKEFSEWKYITYEVIYQKDNVFFGQIILKLGHDYFMLEMNRFWNPDLNIFIFEVANDKKYKDSHSWELYPCIRETITEIKWVKMEDIK